MTPVCHLAKQIEAAFPLARVEADPPAREGGNHHLDVRMGDRLVVIEWRPSLGFGVSLVSEPALDDGPDFRTVDADEALQQVAVLLHDLSSSNLDRDPEWRRVA